MNKKIKLLRLNKDSNPFQLGQNDFEAHVVVKFINIFQIAIAKSVDSHQGSPNDLVNLILREFIQNLKLNTQSNSEIIIGLRVLGHSLRILSQEDNTQDIKEIIKQLSLGFNANALTFSDSGEVSFISTIFSYLKNIIPNPVVFDVGANKGEFTDLILKTIQDSQIHIFEPQKAIIEDFLMSLETSKLNNLFVNYLGLSNDSGIVKLFKNSKSHALASIIKGVYESFAETDSSREEIQIIRGYDYCLSKKISEIDYLKVDAEGSEMNIILGFGPMLKNKSIRIIQFEYGINTLLGKSTLKDFYDLLGDNYLLARILPEGLLLVPEYSIELEDVSWANFVAIEKDFSRGFFNSL